MPKSGTPKRSTAQNLIVLYEDNHLIVINKRPSDIVQGDRTGDDALVDLTKTYLKKKYEKPGNVFLGVVHRIDRPVSGAVIFARTSKALSRLNMLFQDKKVNKTYWAVVQGKPPKKSGKLMGHLIRNREKNKSFVHEKERKDSKQGILEYEWVGGGDHYQFLVVKPHTGRHHQIRVQLADMGCPIKGDVKYGARRPNKDASIHLHARQVELQHPVKDTPLQVTAPPPEKDPLWNLFLEEEAKKAHS